MKLKPPARGSPSSQCPPPSSVACFPKRTAYRAGRFNNVHNHSVRVSQPWKAERAAALPASMASSNASIRPKPEPCPARGPRTPPVCMASQSSHWCFEPRLTPAADLKNVWWSAAALAVVPPHGNPRQVRPIFARLRGLEPEPPFRHRRGSGCPICTVSKRPGTRSWPCGRMCLGTIALANTTGSPGPRSFCDNSQRETDLHIVLCRRAFCTRTGAPGVHCYPSRSERHAKPSISTNYFSQALAEMRGKSGLPLA